MRFSCMILLSSLIEVKTGVCIDVCVCMHYVCVCVFVHICLLYDSVFLAHSSQYRCGCLCVYNYIYINIHTHIYKIHIHTHI